MGYRYLTFCEYGFFYYDNFIASSQQSRRAIDRWLWI